MTEPGDDFKDLAETYVIFITENDVFEAGLPIYHIDRTILETGRAFEDESHIIYVNSQIKDETELGRLMHDFSCTDAKNMYYKILADRVRYFKEDEKGVENMCRALEEMREQERLETKYEFVNSLWEDGIRDLERIAKLTKLTLDNVKEALKMKTA